MSADNFIPAQPGFFVVSICAGRTLRLPVIAWRICGCVARPICADDFPDQWVIVNPDGSVTEPIVSTVEIPSPPPVSVAAR